MVNITLGESATITCVAPPPSREDRRSALGIVRKSRKSNMRKSNMRKSRKSRKSKSRR